MVDTQNSQWAAKAKAYKLTSVIGQGSFGLVWRAQYTEDGPNLNKFVAVKIIDLEQF